RHIPTVLLSDGTEPGSPISLADRIAWTQRHARFRRYRERRGSSDPRLGRRMSRARRDPRGAIDRSRLDAALPDMEMGGANSHGAVVAPVMWRDRALRMCRRASRVGTRIQTPTFLK